MTTDQTDREPAPAHRAPCVVRVAWCSRCNVSHAFMSLYTTPDGPPAAEWGDHNEEDA